MGECLQAERDDALLGDGEVAGGLLGLSAQQDSSLRPVLDRAQGLSHSVDGAQGSQ